MSDHFEITEEPREFHFSAMDKISFRVKKNPDGGPYEIGAKDIISGKEQVLSKHQDIHGARLAAEEIMRQQ